MDWIVSLPVTLAIFAGALFILVTVHELGHFLAAKFFNMRVDRFSVGFPPNIFSLKKGETEYVIGATPLGGYVKIAGMIDESLDDEFVGQEPQPDEFRSKPVWQRMIVITAGVIFNVILAVLIYAGVAFSYGEDVLPIESVQGIYISEGSLAHEIGFETGDRIIGVNGKEVEYFNDIFNPSSIMDRNLTFMVEREGQIVNLVAPLNFIDRITNEGFISIQNTLPSVTSQIERGTPAEEVGLQPGDEFVSINGEPVDYWVQVVEKIQNADGAISIEFIRNGSMQTASITPDPETNRIGIYPPDINNYMELQTINYSLAESFGVGVRDSKDTMFGILQGLGKMVSGDISVRDNLGGPVAIANVTKEATDTRGFLGFWQITAFLSITLAIMNMLPIPALDGGHFMFLVYEGITRREPPAKVRMALQQLGFIFLVGLIILVTFNDILRTFGG